MWLQIRSFASRELFEEVLPRLELEGFIVRSARDGADPDSDGEVGRVCLDYVEAAPLSIEALAGLARELRERLTEGGVPAELSVVASPGSPPTGTEGAGGPGLGRSRT